MESFAASAMDKGYRERPDMYISSLGSSPALTSTGKVFVILTPKLSPFSSAKAINLFNIGIASSYCKSSLKWKSPNAI